MLERPAMTETSMAQLNATLTVLLLLPAGLVMDLSQASVLRSVEMDLTSQTMRVMMAIQQLETDVMLHALSKTDTLAQEAPLQLLIPAQPLVETLPELDLRHVMTEIHLMETVAIHLVQLRLDSLVLEALLLLLTLALLTVETPTELDQRLVTMETRPQAMAALLTALLSRLDILAQEVELDQTTSVLKTVETEGELALRSVMMEIPLAEMDAQQPVLLRVAMLVLEEA